LDTNETEDEEDRDVVYSRRVNNNIVQKDELTIRPDHVSE